MLNLRAVASAAALLISMSSATWAVEDLPTGITAKKQGDGWLFADDKGMTLYTFDRDEGAPGKSTCNAECAVTWPPVVAPADVKAQGVWSTILRNDGTPQWAYKGKPLYRFAAEAFAGGTFGDGVGTVWRVAFEQIPTPSEVKIGYALAGQVLTDMKGLTLYAFDKEKPGEKPACEKECLRTWTPIAAPLLANPFDDWSIVVRPDGFHQWAFQGKPLYRYANDVTPGELNGEKIQGWKAVVLEPAPPLPPWATVQASDAGQLIGNEQGITVYAHQFNPNNRRVLGRPANCVGECVEPGWIPFKAAPDAKSIGSWVPIDLPDGTKQWTYKGNKLYTNVADKQPGDFKGIRFGGDRSWAAIMRSGQPMQGVSVGG